MKRIIFCLVVMISLTSLAGPARDGIEDCDNSSKCVFSNLMGRLARISSNEQHITNLKKKMRKNCGRREASCMGAYLLKAINFNYRSNGNQVDEEGRRAFLTIGHYLESAKCEGGLHSTFVGENSEIEVLSPDIISVGHYDKAVRVRVVTNTEMGALGASHGCEGYALEGAVQYH